MKDRRGDGDNDAGNESSGHILEGLGLCASVSLTWRGKQVHRKRETERGRERERERERERQALKRYILSVLKIKSGLSWCGSVD